MKKLGFTLAEVLITLGVIGIVAAITIPNIMTGYQKKVQVAALQRTYNEFQNAIVKYMADNNLEKLSESGISNNSSNLTTFVNSYLKPVSYESNIRVDASHYFSDTCYASIQGNGISCNWHSLDSVLSDGDIIVKATCGKLRTGASFCMTPYGTRYNLGGIYVDTNGKDKPNIAGRDYFAFYYFNDGTVGASSNSQYYHSGQCTGPLDCFQKVMADGWVMNY